MSFNFDEKKIGDIVQMTDYFISINPSEHIQEFKDCEGEVIGYSDEGYTDYLDVRWQPSGLRYGYHWVHLKLVQ